MRRLASTRSVLFAVAVVFALVDCSAAARTTPFAPRATEPPASTSVTFRLTMQTARTAAARRALYVSTGTQGIGVAFGASPATFGTLSSPNAAFDVSGGSGLCTTVGGTRSCTLTVPAPLGTDDFRVSAWDAVPSGGAFAGAHLLSSATIRNQTVRQGVANAVGITLDRAVSSIALALSTPTLAAAATAANGGGPQTTTLTATVRDDAGNVILGGTRYTDQNGNPVTIMIQQSATTNGGPVLTTLGATTVTPSSPSITVTYPGGSTWGTVFTAVPSGPIGGTAGSTTLAVTPTITEFSSGITAGASPSDIVSGPDGALWFAEGTGGVGRITTSGAITQPVTTTFGNQITVGPDNNLWFTIWHANGSFPEGIGRVTTGGSFTDFSSGVTPGSFPYSVTTGPDGDLWFTENTGGGRVGRITTSGVVTEFTAGITSNVSPSTITAGPDGNLWFTEFNHGVARITTAGVVTEFTSGISSHALGIAVGPDGALWFAEQQPDVIGRITTSGAVTEMTTGITPSSNLTGITSGTDGALWFSEQAGNRIGRITTGGAVTEYASGISSGAGPSGLRFGPDGNLWFAESAGNRIGRLIY